MKNFNVFYASLDSNLYFLFDFNVFFKYYINMEKILLNEIDKIVELLKENKIIALPTDTIYGFSCLATSDETIDRLYKIKERNESKQFIILVGKNYNLSHLVRPSDEILEFVSKNSPAPLTMIVEKNPTAPISRHFSLPTLAIRIPDDEFLQNILDKVGFIISTSCNIQGEPPLNTWQEIATNFPSIDGLVKRDNLPASKPSTIVDLTSTPFNIIRQGEYVVSD